MSDESPAIGEATPRLASDVECCADWKPGIAKLNGPLLLAQSRNPHLSQTAAYHFTPFVFCPWCGKSRPASASPVDGATPTEEPECDEDCIRCSGEYCDVHFNEPCDCDTLDRHGFSLFPSAAAASPVETEATTGEPTATVDPSAMPALPSGLRSVALLMRSKLSGAVRGKHGLYLSWSDADGFALAIEAAADALDSFARPRPEPPRQVGEFHWRDGWTFLRTGDDIRLRKYADAKCETITAEAVIDLESWISCVAAVCPRDATDSLRRYLWAIHLFEDWPRSALRSGKELTARFEAAESEIRSLREALAAATAQLDKIIEREAACCPEDVGFDEYIRALNRQLSASESSARSLREEREADTKRLDWLEVAVPSGEFRERCAAIDATRWSGSIRALIDAASLSASPAS